MKYLSLELLKENLEKEGNCVVEDSVPIGFDEDFYRKFLRVLSAPVTELGDIDDETIVKMLEKGEELFASLNLDDTVFSNIFSNLNRTVSTISAHTRRVL